MKSLRKLIFRKVQKSFNDQLLDMFEDFISIVSSQKLDDRVTKASIFSPKNIYREKFTKYHKL